MKPILHIVLPLVVGTWIYLAFRSESLLAFQWLDQFGIDVRSIRWETTTPFNHFIRYCLPDGLWVYAGTAWMLMIWKKTNAWVMSFAVLMVVAEFGQLAGLVPGTYDPLDIVATVVAFTTAVHFHEARRALKAEPTGSPHEYDSPKKRICPKCGKAGEMFTSDLDWCPACFHQWPGT